MQRDQKVGLALGVLLIGAVAAFFFRNEPDPALRVPSLESAETVNREIAEKRVTPYFTDVETEQPAKETRTRPASAPRNENDPRTGERKLPSWEELKADHDDPFAEESPLPAEAPVPAPDPIRLETVVEAAAPAVAPQIEPQPVASIIAAEPLGESPPVNEGVVHEVQRGETLSSIAGKYLGSQAKYYALYEANLDLLRDANDLQVGMKLRIPDPKTISTAAPPKRPKKSREPEPDRDAKTTPADFGDDPASALVVAPTSAERIIEAAPEKSPPEVDDKPQERPQIKFTPAKRRPRKVVNIEAK